MRLLLVVFLLILHCPMRAQQPLTDFDFLVSKIKNDYPGYKDKAKPDLSVLEKSLRSRVQKYPDSLFYYFVQYTSYFKDGHLRVEYNSPNSNNVPAKKSVSSYGQNFQINDNLLKRVDNDLLSGVWTSGRGDIVIIKHPEATDSFVGISINFRDHAKGVVVYEFNHVNDTLFSVIEHSMYENEKPKTKKASLELDGKILEIHDWNMYFTRKTDSQISDNALLYTYHPKYPNGRNVYSITLALSDSTFYMRLPSFAGNKDYITGLISKHWNDITSRPNLIIDIRMNNGGQSDSYEALKPIMYTHQFVTKGVEWYASAGNIAHMEQSIRNNDVRDGEEGLKWLKALVDRMKTNVNGYVVHPYDQRETVISMDTVYAKPLNIGIIIDKSNASAAEQFLLYAKNSKKVTLFGNESTAGVLDYSNVTPNDSPSQRYVLYCPMTRSLRLPDNPIDNIGIEPDVKIPFPPTKDLYDRLDDWVYFVMYYLEELDAH